MCDTSHQGSDIAVDSNRHHNSFYGGIGMSESIYKIIELVGSSPVSWEQAAQNAVESAGMSLRDLRIAEVTKLDMKLDGEQGNISYRARLKLSFKLVSD